MPKSLQEVFAEKLFLHLQQIGLYFEMLSEKYAISSL